MGSLLHLWEPSSGKYYVLVLTGKAGLNTLHMKERLSVKVFPRTPTLIGIEILAYVQQQLLQ